jgi:hypothetical protein
MGPKRAALTNANSNKISTVATNSQGQTQEQLEAEEQSRIPATLRILKMMTIIIEFRCRKGQHELMKPTLDDLLGGSTSIKAARLVASRK